MKVGSTCDIETTMHLQCDGLTNFRIASHYTIHVKLEVHSFHDEGIHNNNNDQVNKIAQTVSW